MVHSLIMAYSLDFQMTYVEPKPATDDELGLFHSPYYLNYLREECNDQMDSDDSDGSDDVSDEELNYGLG